MDYDGSIEQVEELTNEVNAREDTIVRLEILVKAAFIEGLIVDDSEWEKEDDGGDSEPIHEIFWNKSSIKNRLLLIGVTK